MEKAFTLSSPSLSQMFITSAYHSTVLAAYIALPSTSNCSTELLIRYALLCQEMNYDPAQFLETVCSFCDDGGTMIGCEGRCLRSFHATRQPDAVAGLCPSLGFTRQQVQAMPNFQCQNCVQKRHQCFSCGLLGSSDEQNGALVFQCTQNTCGYFYHPNCVAERLIRNDRDAAQELEGRIRAGELFTCPLHVCFHCQQAEDVTNRALQMAVCRRCPKAYHRRCLPRNIAFEERAWEDLMPNRVLIFCMDHEIVQHLGTPRRDHIRFPTNDEIILEEQPVGCLPD